MLTFTYHYPDDPPVIAILLFGQEFTHYVRNDQPAQSFMDGVPLGPGFTEIICDLCNAEILPTDACCYVPDLGRVYCAGCGKENILPHQVKGTLQIVVPDRRGAPGQS